MKFVIVTGLSGAGKSMAVNALEDIGFSASITSRWHCCPVSWTLPCKAKTS